MLGTPIQKRVNKGGRELGADLEIVRSVSGNLNVFTEKFVQNEDLYLGKTHHFAQKFF